MKHKSAKKAAPRSDEETIVVFTAELLPATATPGESYPVSYTIENLSSIPINFSNYHLTSIDTSQSGNVCEDKIASNSYQLNPNDSCTTSGEYTFSTDQYLEVDINYPNTRGKTSHFI